jgi:hypothetical protein
MFLPKPKTTRKLSELVLQQGEKCHLDEAVVIGNCARLEFLMVTRNDSIKASQLAALVTSILLDQQNRWRQRGGEMGLAAVTAFLDRPEELVWNIISDDCFDVGETAAQSFEARELLSAISVTSGADVVGRYLSLVALGLPNGREYRTFAPFSSRDAHVMLQLKRIHEATSAHKPASVPPPPAPPCRARLGLLFRAALSAGKTGRDPNAVPELLALRPGAFGGAFTGGFTDGFTGGFGGGSAGTGGLPQRPFLSPSAAATAAARAAVERAVEPALERFMADLEALEHGGAVVHLRKRAFEAAEEALAARGYHPEAAGRIPGGGWQAAVQRALHAPTVATREGKPVDVKAVLEEAARIAVAAVGILNDEEVGIGER